MREFRMKVWLEAWLSEYGKAWCSMKIEKVNDNQIRCTLTREDLAERQIKLSELAYGTEKAKLLFHDMMQQAAYEFGFEADDIPLMIEAIPLSQDTIILVITKVEYPEELDTRFSRFSDPDPEDVYEEAMAGGGAAPAPEGADDIPGLFRRIQEERRKAADAQGSKDSFVSEENDKKKETPVNVLVDITKLFVFSDFSEITRLAHTLQGFYQGNNDLYKNEAAHKYYLLVSKSRQTPEGVQYFIRIWNAADVYAGSRRVHERALSGDFEKSCASDVGRALKVLRR